jgi:hypothetical protein
LDFELQDLMQSAQVEDAEQEIEALCNLMATVGKELDHRGSHTVMDQYLEQLQQLGETVSVSRCKFLILDTVELRQNGWKPRREADAPKKLDEIRKEVRARNESTFTSISVFVIESCCDNFKKLTFLSFFFLFFSLLMPFRCNASRINLQPFVLRPRRCSRNNPGTRSVYFLSLVAPAIRRL